MHTLSAPERAVIGSARRDVYTRFEFTDPDGVWINASTDLGTPDWFISCQLADSIDYNTMSMSAVLKRDRGLTVLTSSLAPLREDSTLNRDASAAYAPKLDLVRMWRTSVAVVASSTSPVGGDWNEFGKGYIDTIDVDDLSPTIQLTGRGEEAQLLDTEILELRTYAVDAPEPMEDVIQQMIDDNVLTYGAPTIYVPVPMNRMLENYAVPFGNLMNALQTVATFNGAVLRYRHDSAGVNRLTLFVPPREAEAGDEVWSIAATEYLRIPLNRLDISGVRNFVPLRYNDADTGEVESVWSPANMSSPSITRYGLRPLPIDLAEDTQVTTFAAARAFADAVRMDLEFPSLQQRFESFAYWFPQLCDYGKLTANNVHYDTDQYGGVTAFTHLMANGTLRTTVDIGGQPKGGFKRWIPLIRNRIKPPPGGPINDPVLPPFTPGGPPTIPDLYIWYTADAPEINALATDAIIDPVPDQSGNDYDADSDAGNPLNPGNPIKRIDIPISGPSRNAMYFFQAQALSPIVPAATGRTIFFVGKRVGPPAASKNAIGFESFNSTFGEHNDTGNERWMWYTNEAGVYIPLGPEPTSDVTILLIAATATSAQIYQNGALIASIDPGNSIVGTGRFILGGYNPSGGNNMSLYMFEAGLFQRKIEPEEIQGLNQYLARWVP